MPESANNSFPFQALEQILNSLLGVMCANHLLYIALNGLKFALSITNILRAFIKKGDYILSNVISASTKVAIFFSSFC